MHLSNDASDDGSHTLKPTRGSILVIDDDPAVRRLFNILLSSEGYLVVTARNAAEALGLLSVSRWSLVVIDLNLPDMDGEELLRVALEAGYEGKTVLVSADVRATDASARMGVPLIQKPFDPFEMLQRFAELTPARA